MDNKEEKPRFKLKVDAPRKILRENLLVLLKNNDFDEHNISDFPLKWERHGDLVLFPEYCFQNPVWENFGEQVWVIVKDVLKCKRIARKQKIKNDNFRTPQVEMLSGSDTWVTHIDNGIKYFFDVTKCMFSSGNISEKLRIANLSCEGETVVDLYAGIGYFTLPFIIHAKAHLVHACEWNPNAVEALKKSLTLNGVEEKCIIHFGDNKLVCPEKVADRVNLGLIPSSENGWETACRALKPINGGILHVHGNVTSNPKAHPTSAKEIGAKLHKHEWIIWTENVCDKIREIFFNLYETKWTVDVMDIVRIKSYAPHIDHMVADIKCAPS